MTDMPPYLAVKDEDKNSGQDDSDSSSDVDDWDLLLSFDQPRHLEPIKGAERVEHSWRVKEKYKTHCVALVLCLNVGVDPPDVVKTQPCARLECWIDPQSMSQSKALESIGHALQSQYERWQPRARYKQSLDPTSDEVKKLCCSLRRNAKDERVLFHYNGHGVPKPTTQGEIWVFNRSYTQYIPLSMYDLQTWMGAPSLYVYDCSNAGVIVDNFKQFAEQHEREYEAQVSSKSSGEAGAAPPPAQVSYKNCIQLGACAAGQALPMNPELPADLFTACLTTPVKMAMKWFVLRTRTRIAPHNVHDLIDKIPGQVTDRRTMLGELNWIFTAITDTIAWSSLPPELFQQLFRADLLTASLCRNFLLADRIMRSYNCTPVSSPALPSLAAHPLWAAWEHTLDAALAQLPALLAERAPQDYRHSAFFRDQLTAFQVWLELGGSLRPPPAQLPMVLQVLLSTLHRVRALQLLCRFLALGGRAVRAVLHVGIFPYMLKLLQASAPNLRASMVYIWSRIVHQDPSCQADLVNAKGHKYFLSVLQDPSVDSEHRTLAAYVLAGIVDNYPPGQEAALQGSMISICLEQLNDGSAVLAQWACIALGRLWRGFDAARWAGVRDLAHEKLFPLMQHDQPEVRAACAFALGAFVAAGGARTEHANALDQQVGVFLASCLAPDAAALVRKEILAALQWLVLIFEQTFIAVYIQERTRRSDKEPGRGGRVDPGQDALAPGARPAPHQPPRHGTALALPSIGFGSIYTKLWNILTATAREPHPEVAQMATDLINYISNQVDSVGREAEARSTSGSTSLPPSPNTQPSPLHEHGARTLPHGHRRGKSGLPHTISEDSVTQRDRESTRDREGKDRDSTSSNSSQVSKKPIVGTRFVEWAGVQLSRGSARAPDVEARAHHERVWRRARNAALRRGRAAARARAAPRHAGLPLALPAAAAGRALPPVRAARRRRQQGQLRDLGLGQRGEAVRGRVAARVGPRDRARVHERARARAARVRVALGTRARVPTERALRRRRAGARRGVARTRRAPRARLPPAARATHLQSSAAGVGSILVGGGKARWRKDQAARPGPGRRAGVAAGRGRRRGRVRRGPAGRAAALERAPAVAGAGGRGTGGAAVGRARRAARGGVRHGQRRRRHGAMARRRPAGGRVRGRKRARVGRARGTRRGGRARARASARRAGAVLRAARRPALHGGGVRRGRGALPGHAHDARHARAARAAPARRRRRAPRRRAARLRVGEPVHHYLRPEGLAAQHHQVPRGVHGRAHRARLLPRLPPAQVRAGRRLERLVGVGVRGRDAPVTLALLALPRALPLAQVFVWSSEAGRRRPAPPPRRRVTTLDLRLAFYFCK